MHATVVATTGIAGASRTTIVAAGTQILVLLRAIPAGVVALAAAKATRARRREHNSENAPAHHPPLAAKTVAASPLSPDPAIPSDGNDPRRATENGTGVDLSGRRLRDWGLEGVDLRGAKLTGATARSIDLSHRDLSGAVLRNLHARGLRLGHADLSRADLSWADLRCADLGWANLDRTDTTETELTGADLRGAMLATCQHLELAHLRDAIADDATQWPVGFDPRAAGVYFVRPPS